MKSKTLCVNNDVMNFSNNLIKEIIEENASLRVLKKKTPVVQKNTQSKRTKK